jgi:hypothetical protein
MPKRSREPSKAAIARARALYDAGETSLADIAKALKLSDAAFRARRKLWDWPPRAAMRKASPAADDSPDDEAATPGDEAAIIDGAFARAQATDATETRYDHAVSSARCAAPSKARSPASSKN